MQRAERAGLRLSSSAPPSARDASRSIDTAAAERSPGRASCDDLSQRAAAAGFRPAADEPAGGDVSASPGRCSLTTAFATTASRSRWWSPRPSRAARAAAGLVEIRYDREGGAFDLRAHFEDAYKPEKINAGFETDTHARRLRRRRSPRRRCGSTRPTRRRYENHMPDGAARDARRVGRASSSSLYTSMQTVASVQAAHRRARCGIAPATRPPRLPATSAAGSARKLVLHAETDPGGAGRARACAGR